MMLGVVACAPIQDHGTLPNDPYEPLNRQIFAFNEVVDMLVLKPVAHTYRFIVPEAGRTAISNALRNFREPVVMINAVLQLDFQRAFTSLWRFLLNSTLGVAGLYDFAGENTELKYRNEDFGQTLGVWAQSTDSDYLVLPILGPSTTRDAFGRLVDVTMDPWTYALDTGESIAIGVTEGISTREELLDTIDDVYETSFDPYATIRSGYLQRRKAEILNTHNPSAAD